MKWVAVVSFFVCFATLSRGGESECEGKRCSEFMKLLNTTITKDPESRHSSNSTSLTERNNSTTSFTETNNSTASVTERNNSTTSVTERNNSTTSVRERKKESRECSAGSRWFSKCHQCSCSKDGHAECKRVEVCLFEDYGDPIRCKPNTTFMNDCNECTCLENGQVACTMLKCMSEWPSSPISDDLPALPEYIDGPALLEPVGGYRESLSTRGRKDCKPGSRWQSRCNACFCTEDGLPACTEMACPEVDNDPVRTCAPDSQWMNDCNNCWCDSGSAVCTRMGCNFPIITEFHPIGASSTEKAQINLPINRSVRATAQGPPKNCKPGTEFRMDCNKCLCDNEGQNYSCTRIDCAALNGNGNGATRKKRATAQVQTQCVPESVFNQGCNVCRCEADGNHATCSIKRCKEDDPDEDADDLSPGSDLSFRCNPGEQFKRGCNDCTCSADGKSVFCTIRLCDQDITPTI